jgi:hypothetical protein
MGLLYCALYQAVGLQRFKLTGDLTPSPRCFHPVSKHVPAEFRDGQLGGVSLLRAAR